MWCVLYVSSDLNECTCVSGQQRALVSRKSFVIKTMLMEEVVMKWEMFDTQTAVEVDALFVTVFP